MNRAAASGKTLDADVAGNLFDTANGVPNDAQLLAFCSWEAADQKIDALAVDRATTQAVNAQKEEFRLIWDSLTSSRHLLLKHIARGGVANLMGAETIRALGVSHTSVRKAAAVLQNLELIVRRDTVWTISSGFFQAWLMTEAT